MPDAKRNLFEGKIVVKTSGKKMLFPHMAYLRKVYSSVKFHIDRSELHAIEAGRTLTQTTASTAKSSLQCNVMDMHRLLCHAHEGVMRNTVKMAGVTLTGE